MTATRALHASVHRDGLTLSIPNTPPPRSGGDGKANSTRT
jgi:hypothetical protein